MSLTDDLETIHKQLSTVCPDWARALSFYSRTVNASTTVPQRLYVLRAQTDGVLGCKSWKCMKSRRYTKFQPGDAVLMRCSWCGNRDVVWITRPNMEQVYLVRSKDGQRQNYTAHDFSIDLSKFCNKFCKATGSRVKGDVLLYIVGCNYPHRASWRKVQKAYEGLAERVSHTTLMRCWDGMEAYWNKDQIGRRSYELEGEGEAGGAGALAPDDEARVAEPQGPAV